MVFRDTCSHGFLSYKGNDQVLLVSRCCSSRAKNFHRKENQLECPNLFCALTHRFSTTSTRNNLKTIMLVRVARLNVRSVRRIIQARAETVSIDVDSRVTRSRYGNLASEQICNDCRSMQRRTLARSRDGSSLCTKGYRSRFTHEALSVQRGG